MVGLSQTALGKRVGITFQQIQKYEKGANRIGAGRLHDFADILDVPVSFFYDGFNDHAGATTPPSDAGTLATAALLAGISDPAVRRKLRALIRAVADRRGDAGA